MGEREGDYLEFIRLINNLEFFGLINTTASSLLLHFSLAPSLLPDSLYPYPPPPRRLDADTSLVRRRLGGEKRGGEREGGK